MSAAICHRQRIWRCSLGTGAVIMPPFNVSSCPRVRGMLPAALVETYRGGTIGHYFQGHKRKEQGTANSEPSCGIAVAIGLKVKILSTSGPGSIAIPIPTRSVNFAAAPAGKRHPGRDMLQCRGDGHRAAGKSEEIEIPWLLEWLRFRPLLPFSRLRCSQGGCWDTT